MEIKTQKIRNATVSVPGSKSYTHRLLIATALSDGPCSVDNILRSEDTLLTLNALRKMGVVIEETSSLLKVRGTNGCLRHSEPEIYLANSGTSMRLLTAVAALGSGVCTLTGTKRMEERPIQDLLEAMAQIGVLARSIHGTGCPPVEIHGGTVSGGTVAIQCHVSSQYLSALLLIGPYTRKGLDITVTRGPVSRPYIDMTIDIMSRLGVEVKREGDIRYQVTGGGCYRHGDYMVEPDASHAGYFWAAAAITGASIKVRGITLSSCQGDVRFVTVLEKMGCRIDYEKDGIVVTGRSLSGIEVDMADMPDVVPTLAVVAAFAEGKTVITNVAHLKEKESDRLGSVACELLKMGIQASATESGLVIQGGRPRSAEIETYHDHRMAMSFALAGLVTPGIRILDEMCVEKSFPDFWEVFGKLYA
ncbi:MAG: 3-phosphoshikimate 1-carboxyvinyltransferase [Thermodesulfobacteriota bacterium]